MQSKFTPDFDLTPTEAAYIAGFFDGEGSVGISKVISKGKRGKRLNPNYVLHVKFSNSDREVLQWIADRIGGWILTHKTTSTRAHWKLVRKGTMAAKVLRQMLPYLIVKKSQSQYALEFQERQSAHKNRYEAGRIGPVPRTSSEIEYKEHYFSLLQKLKKPLAV